MTRAEMLHPKSASRETIHQPGTLLERLRGETHVTRKYGTTVRACDNPPNPYASTTVDWLGDPPDAKLRVWEENARRVLTRNDSPDLPFRYSVNPYRGCIHGCAYCYARPSHQYLGFGAGTDFDRQIVVKVNAADRLAAELRRRSYDGDVIAFSGNTDCYQPLEVNYRLTRACLEVCAAHSAPVGLITKSALVARDTDVLARMNVVVTVSIPFANDELARKIEPWAPKPSRRFEALETLSAAGIATGIAIAPVIPGLNDADIPELLERGRAAGASRAFMTLLRLPREVEPVFTQRIRDALPERSAKILHGLEEVRGDPAGAARFHQRFIGQGPRWQIISQLFHQTAQRLGLLTREQDASPKVESIAAPVTPLRRGKRRVHQLSLFGVEDERGTPSVAAHRLTTR